MGEVLRQHRIRKKERGHVRVVGVPNEFKRDQWHFCSFWVF